MRVDIHSHTIPTDILGLAGKHGPEIIYRPNARPVLRVGSFRWEIPDQMTPESLNDPALRLAEADKLPTDWVGITTGPMFYFYHIEHDLAVQFSKALNDSLARYVRHNPNRLFFMATLPLQDIPESVREIDRAVALGAKGLNIGYNPCGHSLASEWFYPVWEKATQADLPIFIHPAAEGQDADDAEGAGSDDDKYDWHRGALLLGVEGFIHQETLAVASLMLGGVLDDFPSLKFCVPHGGGAVPYQFGRFEEAARREPVRAKRPLREYLKNFYFDPIVHDVRARKLLVDFMGPDNVIVGSNFPGWDMNNGFNFIEELDLSRADKDKIMGGNAIKLFHL